MNLSRAGAEISKEFDPPHAAVTDAVARAIAEDLLPIGDLTASLIPEGTETTVAVVSRATGTLAGTACAHESFRQIDPDLLVYWRVGDGAALAPGDEVASVTGSLRSILTAERTALNFLCHLSGIATLTRHFVDAVSSVNPATRVLDTRKTTPGLRALEKAAVRAGGGHNHRGSLSEAVLVKDNHLGTLSITEAVVEARRRWPGRMVEVECERQEQVDEAVAAGASVVMLDNMDLDQVAACVSRVRAAHGPALVEVSGGVDHVRALAVAAAGADLVSVGALTHSAPSLDLALDLERPARRLPTGKRKG
ncbi:MAG: carboxylating nicotinate-nucleotide diphosphorylase [Acidimicrobiales bacterium]